MDWESADGGYIEHTKSPLDPPLENVEEQKATIVMNVI